MHSVTDIQFEIREVLLSYGSVICIRKSIMSSLGPKRCERWLARYMSQMAFGQREHPISEVHVD
jgi:hypothetical protein